MQINLLRIIDDSAVYELLREIRWSDGVQCPNCNSLLIRKMDMMKSTKPAKSMNVKTVSGALVI